MKTKLLALAAVWCLALAGSAPAAQAPLAVYYSFDTPAPANLFTAMQSEMTRILAPSGISAAWLPSGTRKLGDDFPVLVVFRFYGRCGFDGPGDVPGDFTGGALAETDTIDGHVLPFAKVNCDQVRSLIAPALGPTPPDWKTEMLGRALARVSAHEIYHMLAGVSSHADHGIFQPEHSRRDLTAATFSFDAPENTWLRGWLQRQTTSAQMTRTEPASVPAVPDSAVSVDSDSAAFAGR